MDFKAKPLRLDQLRHLERPFSWVPFRLLTSGCLVPLSVSAKALYLVLCLVADRQGLSYWGETRLRAQAGLDGAALQEARQELQRQDLLAYDGRLYQLLSLPLPLGDSPPRGSVNKPRRESKGPEPIGVLLTPLLERLRNS